ncbi:Uncharacterized protein C4orf29 -like protein [Trichinella spiralis]|uniref:Uncharacterized protein C4orf29-like protein n=1 Tax=Trichinella spiralis TaxID=6334 RepID=A0A0V1B7B8_TRISP|nr:Uncharacterized protein C4orf29 -like protein [Trichinella spiralis]
MFADGWGNPADLIKYGASDYQLLSLIKFRREMVKRDAGVFLNDYCPSIKEAKIIENNSFVIYSGEFETPVVKLLPELVPLPVRYAQFEMILPKVKQANSCPLCIHMAGTGDHGFWRRRKFLALPLAQQMGIGTISVRRSCLRYVTDLFVMGVCLIFESAVLLNWLIKRGNWPLGLTGISLGGHVSQMASLAAACYSKPVAIVPCLSWTTASAVFTQGVMARAIPWNTLEKQCTDEFGSSEIYHLLSSQYWDDSVKINLAENNFRAQKLMHVVMDEFTHLGKFSSPIDPSLAIVVAALNDAYVPRSGVANLNSIWPEAEIRYVNTGHIGGYLFRQSEFRLAISDALQRAAAKYEVVSGNVVKR